MTDITLETIRAIVLLGIVIFLWNAGRGRFHLSRQGWGFIIGGFGLLLFGSVLDITDNFKSLNRFVVIGDTATEAFLEKFVGFIGGFFLLAIGFIRWIPRVQNLSDLVEGRTKELHEANELLVGEFAERKEAEEALRDSEEWLRGAIESLQEGFVLYDADDRIVIVNDVFRRINPKVDEYLKQGMRFEDLIRANVESGRIVEAMGREEEFIRERLEQHRNPKGQIIRQFSDGKWYIIKETRTPEGGIAITFTDITDFKKEEEANRRLAEAIDGLSENFALYGPDDRLVMCNQGYSKLNEAVPEATRPGVSYEEHLRAVVANGLAPKAMGREEDYIRERMEFRRNPPGPYEVIRQDGVWLVHEQRVADGSTATIATDITERKRTEEALRESEERLRHIVDTSPFGVSIVSRANRKRLYVNRSFVEMFGGGSDEKIRKWPAAESYSDPSKREQNWAAFERDGILTSDEEKRKRLDGTTWWCLADWRPIEFEGKEAVINWHYDITERKRIEEALVESEEKHRHFSADVAHELRTPLAVLRSHLDNLENTETIQSLIKDVDAMSRLVSQLLTTTRLDSLTVNPNDVADLHAIGAEVAKNLAPFAIKEGRSIEMIGTQDPVIVRGNDDALEMAVRNLVENAIRYSARETVVTIQVSDEPAISVINHGQSIPPEQQKVIFQRFRRADRRSGGAGLGLSIVQRVVEAHQATIDVSDTPGGGTVFKISFPSRKSLKVAAS